MNLHSPWLYLDTPGRWLLAAVVLLVVLVLVFRLLARLLGPRRRYRRAEGLFTPAELRFLAVLEQAVAGRARIYGKVRIADLVLVHEAVPRRHYLSLFNPIACKHVDYVLCDGECRVLCAIELDDASHRRADRQVRDQFVDGVMAEVGIPLLRFAVRSRYVLEEVRGALAGVLRER
ncbi:MAG TPA: DUF2726 domain-containing protein [Candidatus Competibacteraceae bacterium]|nr:DUF2726 domain-containing protein [Candidatus Competibacteraceae bacterium]